MSKPFALVPEDGTPLPVLVVGAGSMGHEWLRTIEASPLVDLAGIVDLDVTAASRAAADIGRPDLPVGANAVELADNVGARAVINVTIPAAHHPVTTEALFSGLPVLGEKPVASSVAQGLSLAAASDVTGQLFMVSQSRRYNRNLSEARRLSAELGGVGILTAEFFKAPHFGGFRDAMDHPLLLDMAIHQFDMARFLLDADPVSVVCEEYNPAWSWYRGDAAATAVFEMSGGERFTFSGSWCSPGLETSWNAQWRISGAEGTVLWDGENPPTSGRLQGTLPGAAVEGPGEGIAGSLTDFVTALRTGTEPMGRVHSNVLSLAMVEAAILSNADNRRVSVDALLEDSYQQALSDERHAEVLQALRSWSSVRQALVPETTTTR